MRGANPAPLANLMERCGDEVRDVALDVERSCASVTATAVSGSTL
jgi:hypothetical protein